jgi:(R,R)-butanediol dehydrogenase / meso-butanediol dehydrogenase / diacetyl reductase
MRQVIVHGPADVRVDEVEEPVAGPRDAVVEIAACGICGTDLTFIARGGFLDGSGAMRLGHEAAGRVVQVGRDVAGLAVGDRVIVNPVNGGQVIGNGGPEGAFTDRLLVRDAVPGKTLFPVPDGAADELGALVEPLAVALHTVNRANPQRHEKVVLFGAGPIGLGITLWLRRRGAAEIVVVDRNAARLERARAIGATATVVTGEGDLRAALAEVLGGDSVFGMPTVDADLYIDAAGAPTVLPEIVAMARPGARVTVAASYKAPVTLDLRRMLMSELTITMAMGYPEEFPKVIAALPEIAEEAQALISHRFAFDDFHDAVAVAQSGDCAKVMVTFPANSCGSAR